MKNATQRKELPHQELSRSLRYLRIKSGLSQGDVRKALGYTSSQFVSNWERGLSEPPVETLVELAKLYRVSEDILIENYIEYRVSNLEREIRKRIDNAMKARSSKTLHGKNTA